MELLGLPYNEVMVTYTAGLAAIGDDVKTACAQIVRNAQSTPALNASKTRDRHDADAVFLEFAAGRNRAGMAASLRCEQAGVSDERYSAAQSKWGAPDAGRCAVAKCGRNIGNAAGNRRKHGYKHVEVGLVPTTFADVIVSPVVMRKLRPTWQEEGASRSGNCWSRRPAFSSRSTRSIWLLPSHLFAMTLAVTVAGQDYLIESIASNEAFGQVYLYRLLLREARQQAV